MKTILTGMAVLSAVVIIALAALHPAAGVIFELPGAWCGLGLVGVGLIQHAREHRAQGEHEVD